jgi:hypothetical protein
MRGVALDDLARSKEGEKQRKVGQFLSALPNRLDVLRCRGGSVLWMLPRPVFPTTAASSCMWIRATCNAAVAP